jgi:hypothetical protein
MLTFVEKYKGDVYSQNGEDLIIQECIKRINPSLKYAVEFGGADGFYCSNTALLRDQGWQVDMYDLEAVPPYVKKCEITAANVNQVIRPCSVLSIDVDGLDYGIWGAYNGKPDIVVIEINSSFEPLSAMPVNDPQLGTAYFPMIKLAYAKGYFLLCHTGNCIFVLNKHRELFSEITGNGTDNYELYFNRSFL